jgi:hypothetical protein
MPISAEEQERLYAEQMGREALARQRAFAEAERQYGPCRCAAGRKMETMTPGPHHSPSCPRAKKAPGVA